MKAFVMTRYGGPESMQFKDMPMPVMRPNDVLVEVHATALNPVDWKIRQGKLKAALRFLMPQIMGSDLSGVVTELGRDAKQFQKGDAVFGLPEMQRMGSFAEFIAIDERTLAPKPRNLSFAEAAALPLVSLTAWQCLVETIKLRNGEKILIHAGAGGVGTIAIQLAKHLGAIVETTASARNHDFLKELGADRVIDYTKHDFTDKVFDCDAVLDCVGGATLLRSFDVVKPGARVVSIASMPDPKSAKEMGLNPIFRIALRFITRREVGMARRRSVHYRVVSMRPDQKQLRKIGALLENGTIKPVIERTYSFDRAAEAFAQLETGHTRGKLVLNIRE